MRRNYVPLRTELTDLLDLLEPGDAVRVQHPRHDPYCAETIGFVQEVTSTYLSVRPLKAPRFWGERMMNALSETRIAYSRIEGIELLEPTEGTKPGKDATAPPKNI